MWWLVHYLLKIWLRFVHLFNTVEIPQSTSYVQMIIAYILFHGELLVLATNIEHITVVFSLLTGSKLLRIWVQVSFYCTKWPPLCKIRIKYRNILTSIIHAPLILRYVIYIQTWSQRSLKAWHDEWDYIIYNTTRFSSSGFK